MFSRRSYGRTTFLTRHFDHSRGNIAYLRKFSAMDAPHSPSVLTVSAHEYPTSCAVMAHVSTVPTVSAHKLPVRGAVKAHASPIPIDLATQIPASGAEDEDSHLGVKLFSRGRGIRSHGSDSLTVWSSPGASRGWHLFSLRTYHRGSKGCEGKRFVVCSFVKSFICITGEISRPYPEDESMEKLEQVATANISHYRHSNQNIFAFKKSRFAAHLHL